MNKIIESQLAKVQEADLSNYDARTKTWHIPKISDVRMDVGSCYLIELDDSLLNPLANQILVSNWNQGRVPEDKYFKVEVLSKMNRMIKVMGFGYDPATKTDKTTAWTGWLPLNMVKVLERI